MRKRQSLQDGRQSVTSERTNYIPFERRLALLTTRKIQGSPVPEAVLMTSWEERGAITFHKTLGVAQSSALAAFLTGRLQVAP